MTALVVGLVLIALALAIGAAIVLLPRTPPGAAPSGIRQRTLNIADAALRRRGTRARLEDELELAGIGWQPASIAVLVAVLGAVAVLIGIGIAALRPGPISWLIPIVLLAVVVLGYRLVVARRIARRRAAFADQLDDTLQLVASGLRAGHSLARALAAVAQEAESPTAEEFARVINENRLGRDLSEALTDVAERMQSDDLVWAAQAVAINREVGGNLSEVLDHVGETIRERGRIRRQVRSLSAEGRMSANVLIALPIVVAALLAVISPSYISVFVTTPIGWVLIAVCLALFIVGVIWLRRVVRIPF